MAEPQIFIVATEPGIIHQMQKDNPNKMFIPAPAMNNCACNECPHMKLNTLEKVYLCLKNESPEILLDESIRKPAEKWQSGSSDPGGRYRPFVQTDRLRANRLWSCSGSG